MKNFWYWHTHFSDGDAASRDHYQTNLKERRRSLVNRKYYRNISKWILGQDRSLTLGYFDNCIFYSFLLVGSTAEILMATPAKQHDCRGKYLCKIIKENVQYLWVTSYSSGHDYYLTSPAEDEERPFEASQRGSLSSRLLKKHIKQSSQKEKKKALFYVFTLFAVYMSVSNCLYDHHPLECNMKKKLK